MIKLRGTVNTSDTPTHPFLFTLGKERWWKTTWRIFTDFCIQSKLYRTAFNPLTYKIQSSVFQHFYEVSYQRGADCIKKNSSPRLQNTAVLLRKKKKKNHLFGTSFSWDTPAHSPHRLPLACGTELSRGASFNAENPNRFRTPGSQSVSAHQHTHTGKPRC